MVDQVHVIVVDDDPLQVRALTRVLRGAGYTVSGSVDGDFTLGSSERQVVLTDWDPLGPVVVATCRRTGIPVVVLTGGDLEAADVDAPVLRKPLNLAELVSAIAEVLP